MARHFETTRSTAAGIPAHPTLPPSTKLHLAEGISAILAARDGGTVIFFSMATSFTAAALGAEGVGKDVHLIIGNGYVPGHAELTLDLLRRHPALRALFEARYATHS